MKHQKWNVFLCMLLALTVLFGIWPYNINAERDMTDEFPMYGPSDDQAGVQTASVILDAEIVDGAIYAISNDWSGKWASTATSATTVDQLNLFQKNQWNGKAQNFRFEKTSSGSNTYIIYPLEFNGQNETATEKRALWCNCSSMASNPQAVNVTLATYTGNETQQGFEWIVELSTGGNFTIRLKDHPNYYLTAVDTNEGSATLTSPTATGNIAVNYVDTSYTVIPSTSRLWKLTYVIPDGDYYIKNRGDGEYLSYTSTPIGSAVLDGYAETTNQKWTIQHQSNGYYYIKTSGSGYLCLDSVNPVNGESVDIYYNMYQSRFWWKIERVLGGAFRVTCSTREDYGYALTSGGYMGGQHVVTSGLYGGSGFLDEWFLYSSKYEYVTENYYDQGYICRYTTTDKTAREYIESYQRIVNEILLERFGVVVTSTYHELDESPADHCKKIVTDPLQLHQLDDFCQHVNDHLSRYNNVDELDKGTRIKTLILWTGHMLYERKKDDDGNYILDGNGRYVLSRNYPSASYGYNRVIITPSQNVIMNDNNSNGILDYGDTYTNKTQNEIEYQSIFSLLHEISHQLGVDDHYCTRKEGEVSCGRESCYECNSQLNKEQCVMYQRFDITQEGSYEDIFCDFCLEHIQAHLDHHH